MLSRSKKDKRSLCALRSPLQPIGPFRNSRAEFPQYLKIISTGALEGTERMIGAFDDVKLRAAPKVGAHGAQQFQFREFVSRALKEQHRYSDGLQVPGTLG